MDEDTSSDALVEEEVEVELRELAPLLLLLLTCALRCCCALDAAVVASQNA